MSNKKRTIDLIFEKIPPLLTWIIITFPLWGGFFYPDLAAYVILSLNVYFLYRSISLTVLLFMGLIRIRKSEQINWLTRLEQLDNIDQAIFELERQYELAKHVNESKIDFSKSKNRFLRSLRRLPRFYTRLLAQHEKRQALGFLKSEINRLKQLKHDNIKKDWHELRHVIIIPHWREPYHILESTICRIRDMNYPTKRISIVLAAEARDPEGIEISEELKIKYAEYFEQIWVNQHVLQEDELIGKSSNMFSASQLAFAKIDELGWDPKMTTITSCDADSQLPVDYFSNISYLYVTNPDTEYKYFTGAVLLYANIWKLPFFARVKNSVSTLYNIAKLMRTDKLVPFSTYTLSAWMIKEIGFWSPNVTPEDYHTFFKGMFKHPDKVSVMPIFQKIYSDAAEGDSLYDTAKNNYLQERRWAWGISDDGWVLKNLIGSLFNGRTSLRLIYIGLHTIWDHLFIGFSILITFGSNLIVLVNNRFAYTVLGSNLPQVSSLLIQLTLLFFLFTILLDKYIKPEPQGKQNIIQKLFHYFEWFLQPLIGTVLIILPGIEAHTRLLFGRYLEYYLTKKK